jgi:hypothetical protein
VSAPEPATKEQDLPPVLVLALVLLFTVLLSLWAAFLVPLRVGDLPVPVWLVPLAAMLAMARAAARRLGLPGALLPALVWLALNVLVLGSTRAEGDLVVPASVSGMAYLYGGMVLWALVVVRASAATRPGPAPPGSGGATPAGRSRR